MLLASNKPTQSGGKISSHTQMNISSVPPEKVIDWRLEIQSKGTDAFVSVHVPRMISSNGWFNTISCILTCPDCSGKEGTKTLWSHWSICLSSFKTCYVPVWPEPEMETVWQRLSPQNLLYRPVTWTWAVWRTAHMFHKGQIHHHIINISGL